MRSSTIAGLADQTAGLRLTDLGLDILSRIVLHCSEHNDECVAEPMTRVADPARRAGPVNRLAIVHRCLAEAIRVLNTQRPCFLSADAFVAWTQAQPAGQHRPRVLRLPWCGDADNAAVIATLAALAASAPSFGSSIVALDWPAPHGYFAERFERVLRDLGGLRRLALDGDPSDDYAFDVAATLRDFGSASSLVALRLGDVEVVESLEMVAMPKLRQVELVNVGGTARIVEALASAAPALTLLWIDDGLLSPIVVAHIMTAVLGVAGRLVGLGLTFEWAEEGSAEEARGVAAVIFAIYAAAGRLRALNVGGYRLAPPVGTLPRLEHLIFSNAPGSVDPGAAITVAVLDRVANSQAFRHLTMRMSAELREVLQVH